MMIGRMGASAALVAGLLSGTAGARAADSTIEVMHQWTSGGEAFALQSIKEALGKQGIAWTDTAVAGGSGANEKQALQARFAAGNPPAATQVQAQDVVSYAEQGSLGNVDALADKEKWASIISPEILPFTKSDGHYVAVPVGEHRENMLWINHKLLQQVGGKIPTNWDEFDALADKFKAAGVIPLALGGEDWQEAELFSDILIGSQGKDFYKKAIVDLQPDALSGPEMVKVFERFRQVLGYTDANRAGRDWNAATEMVISGKAGMQVMGDWAKGEFALAKMTPGKDFDCVSTPGSGQMFVWEADFFGFFKQNNEAVKKLQDDLASVTLEPAVQQTFNMRKGSIPVRTDIDMSGFDACAQKNVADRKVDTGTGGMIPSFIESVAVKSSARGAIVDVITQFANTPGLSAKDAAAKLGESIKGL